MARSRPRLNGLLRATADLLVKMLWRSFTVPRVRRARLPARTDAHRSSSEIGEEDRDLALGRLKRVAAVHQVLGEQDAEIAADRARLGVARVGGAHHLADDLPCVLG